MRKLLVGLVALAAAPMALAATNTYSAGPGLGLAMVDDAYNGSLASMTSSSINVPSIGADTITNVTVTVGMAHTWVGDLTIKLQSPGGGLVTLLNRPGLVTTDDGAGCCGDSSNLVSNIVMTYDDSAATSAELLGANFPGTNDVITTPTSYAPAADGALPAGNLSALDGQNATGLWRLYLGDSAGGDLGSLDSWSITITSVPEPTSLALIALGGLMALRRR